MLLAGPELADNDREAGEEVAIGIAPKSTTSSIDGVAKGCIDVGDILSGSNVAASSSSKSAFANGGDVVDVAAPMALADNRCLCLGERGATDAIA